MAKRGYPGGGGGMVRHTDPETSHEAAGRVNATRLEALIYGLLQRNDPREYAQIEIARLIDEDKWSISPRFRPMEQRGILARCAKKMALNSNNKPTLMEGWRLRRADEPFTKPKPRQKKACQWLRDDLGAWGTACGNTFELWIGSPAENRMRFCCYCGKPLQDTPPPPRRKRRTKAEMAAARLPPGEVPDWLR